MSFPPPIVTGRERDNNTLTLNQQQIINIGGENDALNPFPKLLDDKSEWSQNTREGYENPTILDFRKPLLDDLTKKTSTVTGIAPNYRNQLNTIEGKSNSRINMLSPGQKGDVYSYTKGKIVNGEVNPAVDKINAQPIYKSRYVKGEDEGISKNDLVKFRIAAILRDGEKVFMHFRAFIDEFSDKYGAKWDSIQYMGRGEEFYKYGGFSRNISLCFPVTIRS